jgi:hypothetical protein
MMIHTFLFRRNSSCRRLTRSLVDQSNNSSHLANNRRLGLFQCGLPSTPTEILSLFQNNISTTIKNPSINYPAHFRSTVNFLSEKYCGMKLPYNNTQQPKFSYPKYSFQHSRYYSSSLNRLSVNSIGASTNNDSASSIINMLNLELAELVEEILDFHSDVGNPTLRFKFTRELEYQKQGSCHNDNVADNTNNIIESCKTLQSTTELHFTSRTQVGPELMNDVSESAMLGDIAARNVVSANSSPSVLSENLAQKIPDSKNNLQQIPINSHVGAIGDIITSIDQEENHDPNMPSSLIDDDLTHQTLLHEKSVSDEQMKATIEDVDSNMPDFVDASYLIPKGDLDEMTEHVSAKSYVSDALILLRIMSVKDWETFDEIVSDDDDDNDDEIDDEGTDHSLEGSSSIDASFIESILGKAKMGQVYLSTNDYNTILARLAISPEIPPEQTLNLMMQTHGQMIELSNLIETSDMIMDDFRPDATTYEILLLVLSRRLQALSTAMSIVSDELLQSKSNKSFTWTPTLLEIVIQNCKSRRYTDIAKRLLSGLHSDEEHTRITMSENISKQAQISFIDVMKSENFMEEGVQVLQLVLKVSDYNSIIDS